MESWKLEIGNWKFILPLLLWQLISVYLMAVGAWPTGVAWVNLVLIVLYIIIAPAFEGLLLTIASMAFYVVLPQHYSDTLAMWRPVVGVLFLKSLLLSFRASLRVEGSNESISQNADSSTQSLASIRQSSRSGETPSLGMTTKGWVVKTHLLDLWKTLFTYEKLAAALFILAVLSLALARYPLRGLSQLVFLLNTALLYFVIVWTVKSRQQIVRLLKYGALSTGLVIALGYVQFIATLFSNAYYFWQYWALRVASLYYGLPLAKVMQYSNSWVTVSGEEKTLRMFSIMTSSHAFAMVCVFFLVFALPLLYLKGKRFGSSPHEGSSSLAPLLSEEGLGEAIESSDSRTGSKSSTPPTTPSNSPPRGGEAKMLWTSIVLACLALIISGTRGVWAGMLPALVVAAVLYYWQRWSMRQLVAPILTTMMLVVILFEASPLLDRAFTWIRNAGGEGTLDRVVSIIDPSETSNAGRLKMWKAASVYALRHPLGVGYANFVVTLNSASSAVSFDEAASQENALYRLPQRYITAHSLYLQVLVELSIFGFALFGLFWLQLYYEMWKYIQVQREAISVERVYIATLALVLLWFLAYSVFDVTWLNDKILLYTFLVFGIARVVFTNANIRMNAN